MPKITSNTKKEVVEVRSPTYVDELSNAREHVGRKVQVTRHDLREADWRLSFGVISRAYNAKDNLGYTGAYYDVTMPNKVVTGLDWYDFIVLTKEKNQ